MKNKLLALLLLSVLILITPSQGFCQNNDNSFKVFKLNNGQTVVIKEVHANPIVTVDTWVRTGSINETVENNGVSHFLEHLFFKGTTHHKAGEMDKILETKGAVFNAATSKDFTHFYTTIASPYVYTALQLQSDMLLNAAVPENELNKERKVVQEEIRRSEDTPDRKVFENMSDLLFTHHPYKYETLGTAELIGTIPRQNIMNYYHQWYIPSNMITIVVGDVDTSKILAEIKSDFNFPKKDNKRIQRKYTREPSINKPALKLEKGNYNTGYMLMGFKGVPAIDKKESHALDLAAAILGDGETSRLYQDLKENQGIVTDISAGHYSLKDDSIFYINSNFPPQNYELVKQSVLNNINKLRETPVTQEELNRAKTQFQREFLYSNESVENIANSVGYNMVTGDNIAYYTKYLEELNSITPKDIQKACKKYLVENKSATSILLPQNTNTENIVKSKDSYKNTTKSVLKNGITTINDYNKSNEIVALSVFVKGGKLTESIPGINDVIASSITKGTSSKSALEISKALEDSGIIITPSTNQDYFEIQLKSTRKDFDKAFSILTDIIKNPAFSNKYIDQSKKDLIESIAESRDVPSSYAMENFTRTVYPNQPYGNVGKVLEKSIPTITRTNIISYYNQTFIPENMVFSVSGNISNDEFVKKVYAAFPEESKSKQVDINKFKQKCTPVKSNKTALISKDTSAASIFLGWKASSFFNDKEFASLKLISTILGNGMSSRLFVDLREKQGLAYTVAALYPTRIDDSYFALYIGTNPINSTRVINGFFDEINKIKTAPVSNQELSDAKEKLLGQYALSQETNQEKAHLLGAFEAMGKDYKFNWQFAELINSVTCGDIISTANKYFNNPYALSVVAPHKYIETIEKDLQSESKR